MIVDKGKSCSDMTSSMITNKGSYFLKSHSTCTGLGLSGTQGIMLYYL